jgi:hypothetical protein
MSTPPPDFKRIVVGLPHSSSDYAGVEAIADFAERLRLSVLGAFLEDAGLRHLGALPCVREYQPLGRGWQPIESAGLGQMLDSAAESARRLFMQAVGGRDVDASFAVMRGPPAKVIDALTGPTDIVGVVGPQHPADGITAQFNALYDAALAAACAVMIAPGKLGSGRGGAVLAAVSGPEDPSLSAALAVAAAVNEPRVTLITSGGPMSSPLVEQARSSSVEVTEIPARWTTMDAGSFSAIVGRARGRLLVITRGILDRATLRRIVSAAGLPLLLVEPFGTAAISPAAPAPSGAAIDTKR